MLFNVGDYVTRASYNNDTVFKIIDIKDDIAILQGVNIRLIADSNVSDLVFCEKCKELHKLHSICNIEDKSIGFNIHEIIEKHKVAKQIMKKDLCLHLNH